MRSFDSNGFIMRGDELLMWKNSSFRLTPPRMSAQCPCYATRHFLVVRSRARARNIAKYGSCVAWCVRQLSSEILSRLRGMVDGEAEAVMTRRA